MITFIFLLILAFVVVIGFFLSWFTVEQQTVRFVESFGKFKRVAKPGLNFKVPFIETVSDSFDMRLQQFIAEVETKTKDNVFVSINVAVQYEPQANNVQEAYYRLQNPENQISSYVFDVVRSKAPILNLDDLFVQKNDIAIAVKEELATEMAAFGYSIEKALVTDIVPDEKVVDSMNSINAAQRDLEAAKSQAEAQKIIKVKNAEAEAESKALNGKGIADERKAIIEGLKESVKSMAEATGSNPQDVMTLVMMTQYFDTLKAIGVGSNTIMIPSNPAGMNSIAEEIRNSVVTGNLVTKK